MANELTPGSDQLISEVNAVFESVPRPLHFTDHEHCCECAEHDATLSNYEPGTIPRAALGHGGWDPITFSTDGGFRYYLPALIRMALTQQGDDYYIDQFLFQLIRDGAENSRWRACSPEQRAMVSRALHLLLEHRLEEIEHNLDADHLMQALEIWSETDEGDPSG